MAEHRAVKRLLRNLEDIKKQVSGFSENTAISEIAATHAFLNNQWNEFQHLERTQKGRFDDANIEGVEKIEKLYSELARGLFRWQKVNEEHQQQPNNNTMNELVLNQSNFLQEISAINKREGDIRLPRVNIPIFSGAYSEFPSFRDLFESSIHNNQNISKVHKLQYLKGLIKGEAFSLIKHLSVTESNYEDAWDKLNKRYDKPNHLVCSLVKQFMEQPNMQQCCSKSLRQLADVSDEVVRGLGVFKGKADGRDPWLVYVLVNKLDIESKEAWAHATAENDFPTLTELLTFINKRSDALENLQSMSKNKSHLTTRTAPSKKVISMTVQTISSCPFCTSEHYLGKCEEFLKLPVSERKRVVVERKLCFNCLASTHQAKICRSKYNCKICRRRHHLTLHVDTEKENNVDPCGTTSLNVMMQPNLTNCQAILPTAMVNIVGKDGDYYRCRALLDSGSQSSFISEDCIQRLRLSRKKANVNITGIAMSTIQSKGRCSIVLRSLWDSAKQIELDALILKQLPSKVPGYHISREEVPLIKDIQLADPSFNKTAPIDILVGADKFFEILESEQRRIGSTTLQKTVFGWVVSGQIKDPTLTNSPNFVERLDSKSILRKSPNLSSVALHSQSAVDMDNTLRRFWEIEEIPKLTQISPEEEKCQMFYTNTLKRRKDGRYVVKLPFREPRIKLGNSINIATNRLLSLERKLAKDESLRRQYIEQMREYVKLDHMVEIPQHQLKVNDENSFYLPHHAVMKETSETTKVRIVFDGSSKTTNGTSLNDSLMVGPTIQPTLWVTLMRFRRHRIALTADIERMYRQVVVSEDDSDYQRLLWRENSWENIKQYRLTTVTFGLACSAYLAIQTLQHLAREDGDENMQQYILNDFYVDDLLTGAENEANAVKLKQELSNLLKQGGFILRKWKSNVPSLHEGINNYSTMRVCTDISPATTVLGLHWHPTEDIFTFRVSAELDGPITKRKIISEASRIFDPLGFLSPSIILLKIIFQKLWLLKLGWDDPIPQLYETEYKKVREEFKQFEKISIPRFNSQYAEVQVHGFADASERAYSAVVYSKSINANGDIIVKFLTAKTKVTPIKKISLPRLELCAAHLLAQLMYSVKDTSNPEARYYAWTDSTIVLAWLSTYPARWKTFVANRASAILEKFPRQYWGHVKSADNPADHGSRGVTPHQLVNLNQWWYGPEWLKYSNEPNYHTSESKTESIKNIIEKELSKSKLPEYVFTTTTDIGCLSLLFERKSKLNKILRVVAYVLRYINNSRCSNSRQRQTDELKSREIEDARIGCVKWAQSIAFEADIVNLRKHNAVKTNSRLTSLAPFIDAAGVLRVGGRLFNADCEYDNKHPVILPADHIFTERVIWETHHNNLHAGPMLTNSLIRQHYWIVNGRAKIRSQLKKCVICVKYAHRTSKQLMGNLPIERVTPTRPFTNSGIDFAGPLYFATKKGRGATQPVKGYLCVFVCLSVKAIHIEPVSDLTSEAFLAALKRFTARRGIPSQIYTDNGSNFIGAKRILNDAFKLIHDINKNHLLSEFLSSNRIEWHFIPPSSPHIGGLWESAVKSVKTHLLKSVNNINLTFEEMATLLCQIENILNSRPLYTTSCDDNYEVLTPAHFLIGTSTGTIAEAPITSKADSSLSRWQRIQTRVQSFWRKYSTDYLNTLQQRYKWKQPLENLKVDDIVIIKEENTAACKWPLGRIIQVHPGNDGMVRVVTIKLKNTIVQRPVVKLCKLPIC